MKLSPLFAAFLGAAAIFLSSVEASSPAPDRERKSAPKEYAIRTWTVDDGLPQSTPLAIAQTLDGYLWIGTYSGLARFDGLRFTTFNSANTPALFSDAIHSLLADKAGNNLWIGTSAAGLVRYDGRTFHAIPLASKLSLPEITCLAESANGIWVGTVAGLFRVRENNLINVPIPGFHASTPIRGLYCSSDESVWIATPKSVIALRGETLAGRIETPKVIKGMYGDSRGNLWLSWSGGYGAVVDRATHSTTASLNFQPASLLESKGGAIWIGTSHGAWMEAVDANPETIRQVQRLADSPITCLYQDMQENLWLGLESGGLHRLKRKAARILGTDQGLGTAAATSLLQDQSGSIWTGTFGKGLYRWNGNRFEPAAIPRSVFNITTLAETSPGKLWFGTYGGNAFQQFPDGQFQAEQSQGLGFRAVAKDLSGGLWIARIGGGCAYFKDGERHEYRARHGLANDQVMAIAIDNAGDAWFGTINGLSRFRDGEFESYFQKDGLGGNDVRALFVDSRGVLWIGTSAGGLARFENGKFKSIRAEHGILSDRIAQIIEDDSGNLWMGTINGIVRVPLEELDHFSAGKSDSVHAIGYGREEGLLGNECGSGFQPSCLKTDSGELWFATSAGIIVIDPESLPTHRAPPQVHVENAIIDGKLNADAIISVPPGARRIEFQYTGVDLSTPRFVRFRYRLEGYDTDWVNAGNRREAIYTQVPPGSYRFHAMAANNLGIWSEPSTPIFIKVLPFFWQTFAFRIASGIAFVGAFGMIFWSLQNRRHRRNLRELEQRHALEMERTRIAQDMHDGLGASLVKISLLGDLVGRRLGSKENEQPQLRRISETARQAMREMDEIVWAVNPRHDTLDSLAGYLGQFAQEHFSNTSITCHLEIPNELPPHRLNADTRHNLYLATKEALNNILKHSHATQAWIRMELKDTLLVVEIEDNGSGVQENGAPGDGLENMRTRLGHLKGSMTVRSRQPQGTIIALSLPVPGKEIGI